VESISFAAMRRVVSFLGVVALGVAAGCGEEETVSDTEIVEAIGLERSPDSPAYAIGGDPFCEVEEDLLNDETEVEQAKAEDELGLVITDSEQTVGVQAVPPFDPSCEKKARRALNGLAEE
jgi:hypothetical protein